jgi:hypothetical protein
MGTVTNSLIILDQAVGECSGDFGSVDWLLFPFFGSGYRLLFHLFWIRLLVTVPIILDQQPDPKNGNRNQQPDLKSP